MAWLDQRIDMMLGWFPDQAGLWVMAGHTPTHTGGQTLDAGAITMPLDRELHLASNIFFRNGQTGPPPWVGTAQSRQAKKLTAQTKSARSCHIVGSRTLRTARSSGPYFPRRRGTSRGVPTQHHEGNHRLWIQPADQCQQRDLSGTGHDEVHLGRFNPREGVVHLQSAAKGLSILCCQARARHEMEEIKVRGLREKLRRTWSTT
jgi:hypothetical protein